MALHRITSWLVPFILVRHTPISMNERKSPLWQRTTQKRNLQSIAASCRLTGYQHPYRSSSTCKIFFEARGYDKIIPAISYLSHNFQTLFEVHNINDRATTRSRVFSDVRKGQRRRGAFHTRYALRKTRNDCSFLRNTIPRLSLTFY